MDRERKKLFLSAVFIIIYVLLSILFKLSNNTIISKNTINNISFFIELFGLLLSIYFIYLSNKEIDLNEKRNSILLVSILFFMINIISGVIGFSVCKKLKNTKRVLPNLEDIDSYNKYVYIICFIICMVLLFFVPNYLNNIYGLLINYVLILFMMVFLFRKELKRDFMEFKNYFKEYNFLVMKTWGLTLVVLIFLSTIISLTTSLTTSTNQLNLQKTFIKYPLAISFLSIIYAPLAEELMFRGIIKKLIKDKWIFIIISSILFGVVHVIDDFTSYIELIYILVYSTIGFSLAYLYYKTNNIFSNIYFHFLQNFLSIIGMIIMLFK